MSKYPKLDEHLPFFGPCACEIEDKRHLIWDFFMAMAHEGRSMQEIAFIFGTNVNHVKAVVRATPYSESKPRRKN